MQRVSVTARALVKLLPIAALTVTAACGALCPDKEIAAAVSPDRRHTARVLEGGCGRELRTVVTLTAADGEPIRLIRSPYVGSVKMEWRTPVQLDITLVGIPEVEARRDVSGAVRQTSGVTIEYFTGRDRVVPLP
jgi:hypothetical protein